MTRCIGARPLKRVIQRSLQDPLAEMILSGDVMDGATVTVSAGPDGLIIGDRIASVAARAATGRGGSLRKRAARAALFHFERSGAELATLGTDLSKAGGDSCGLFSKMPAVLFLVVAVCRLPAPALAQSSKAVEVCAKTALQQAMLLRSVVAQSVSGVTRSGSDRRRQGGPGMSTRWARKRRS